MSLRVCKYKKSKDGPECGGQMFLESFNESCKECARTRATVCGNCKIHFEWVCLQAGHRIYLRPMKRKELYESK